MGSYGRESATAFTETTARRCDSHAMTPSVTTDGPHGAKPLHRGVRWLLLAGTALLLAGGARGGWERGDVAGGCAWGAATGGGEWALLGGDKRGVPGLEGGGGLSGGALWFSGALCTRWVT